MRKRSRANFRPLTLRLMASVAVLMLLSCTPQPPPRQCTGSMAPAALPQGAGRWRMVSSATQSACAVTNDGELHCWGKWVHLLSSSPSDDVSPRRMGADQSWVTAAAGDEHGCAIASDGGLWCWGRWAGRATPSLDAGPDIPLPVPGSEGQTWTSVSAAASTCAVRADGTLWCFGPNELGEVGAIGTDANRPVQVGTDACWHSVSVGRKHTCGIQRDGTLWCWGGNTSGQLGTGSSSAASEPTQVGTSAGWRSVATGAAYQVGSTCAVKDDDTVWCWGWNDYGLGPASGGRSAPAQVGDGVSTVAAGEGHACIITTDGTASCGGANEYGQTGQGTSSEHADMAPVAGRGLWRTMAPGGSHTCGIQQDGTLWCFGRREGGAVGDSVSWVTANEPASVLGDHVWNSLDTGQSKTCAIRQSDRSLWCWGGGESGWVFSQRAEPGQVGSGTGWSSISVGGGHACGISMDGNAWCFGTNWAGEAGISTAGQWVYAPTRIDEDGPWAQVSAGAQCGGRNHTCGIKADGSLWCWGANEFGEVGDGTREARPVATRVGMATDWQRVESAACSTCAMRQDGSLWCWGGFYGDGMAASVDTPTRVGADSDWRTFSVEGNNACGTRADGSLWCWGPGALVAAGSSSPVRIGTESDWATVALGNSACALKTNGTLWCWGFNTYGILGNGSTSNGLTSLPAQVGTSTEWRSISLTRHACGLQADQRARCWGGNESGQVGDGTGWRRAPVQLTF